LPFEFVVLILLAYGTGMWIKELTLKNIRSFPETTFHFSRGINILVGPNNAGKSTVLLPLLSLQDGLPQLMRGDVRLGAPEGRVDVSIADVEERYLRKKWENLWFESEKGHNEFLFRGKVNSNSQKEGVQRIPNREPHNFIYPFVSKRKVTILSEQVTDGTVEAVPPTFENLNAKIDRLSNPEFLPAHTLYMRACDEILGFRVTTAHTGGGKRAVYTVRNMINIPLLAMGEGVMNILGLVVHLAMAEDRLFLIEEPENDVHPRALKALLDLVAEKAQNNQFIITTHSNIVLKKLGSIPSAKVLSFGFSFSDRLPTSTVSEVPEEHAARRAILNDLGYELYDIDMWEAWLILEESSAEKIVREYLIPWFVPSLQSRLRTYSAHSVSEISSKFRDFNNLFVFLYLEPVYRNRAWVLVDGGETEKSVICKLKEQYKGSGWSDDRFRQLQHHDFEEYYPDRFAGAAREVIKLSDKSARREAKKKLLQEVETWIAGNHNDAKKAFAKSAAEIVCILTEIQTALEQK